MTASDADPWDELDALVAQFTDAPDERAPTFEPEPMPAAVAEPAPAPQPMAPSAAQLVDSAPPADGTPDTRQAAREALNDEAAAAARKAVALIRRGLDTGAADFDDAVRALPALHKVVESYERHEAAKRAGGAMVAAVLQIVLDDSVVQVAPPKRTRAAVQADPDVIDLLPLKE